MNKDWHDVIQQYIAGTLPDDEALTLQNALKSDAELRVIYLDYINLDVALGTHAESRAAVIEVLSSPMAGETSRSIRWLTWRPLTAAAAAGILFGMFCTSVVYALVASRQPVTVQTLLAEGFEDAEMILGRGVPSSVGVWSGDLLATVEAKDDVMPAERRRMLVMQPQEGRTQSSACRFLDLTSLPPASAGQSRQIEVTARYYGGKPGVISRLRMRLTVFAEEAAEARRLFVNGGVPEFALVHVEKSSRMKVEEWNTVRLVVDVPAEAKVLLVSMLTGLERSSLLMPDRYLDDVQVRLITQEAPQP